MSIERMTDERPKNFIERLPAIIDREEEDISHLDPEMVAILYPDRADKTFNVTIVFGPPPPGGDDPGAMEKEYESAVAIARKSTRYRSEGHGRYLRHYATFGIDEVNHVHDVFYRVSEYPFCEILVGGKRVPYGRELWLPLLWFFRKDPLEM
jgi:hypothetical protein